MKYILYVIYKPVTLRYCYWSIYYYNILQNVSYTLTYIINVISYKFSKIIYYSQLLEDIVSQAQDTYMSHRLCSFWFCFEIFIQIQNLDLDLEFGFKDI